MNGDTNEKTEEKQDTVVEKKTADEETPEWKEQLAKAQAMAKENPIPAGQINTYRGKLEKCLEEKNLFTDLLSKAEAKTGVKKLYIFLGIIAVFALYLIFGYGSDLIVTVLGFAYPAYQSVKAVESVQKDDDTQWLIYWVVFGAFNIVEFFSDILLSWFPLYFLVKLAFLGWCMAPVSWNGSNTIYSRFIRPFVLKYQNKIDQAIDEVNKQVDKYAEKAKDAATEAAIRQATSGGKDEEDKKDD